MPEPSSDELEINIPKKPRWLFNGVVLLVGCILLVFACLQFVGTEIEPCSEPMIVASDQPSLFHAPPFDSPYAWEVPGDAWASFGRGGARTVRFSPDGALLVVGSTIGVEAFDTSTLERLWYAATENVADELSFSPDGAHLVGHEYEGLMVWEVLTGRQLAALKLEELQCEVTSPLWSPDNRRIAFGMGKKVYTWYPKVNQLDVLLRNAKEVTSLEWSSDGRFLAAGLKDGVTIVSNADTGQIINQLEPGKASTAAGHNPNLFRRPLFDIFASEMEVSGVVFTQDGKYLITNITIMAVSDPIGHELVWDLQTGKTVSVANTDDIWLSTFTTPIAVSREYKELAVWDTKQKQKILILSDGGCCIDDWTSDGVSKVAAIITTDAGERITLWHLEAPDNPQYIDGYGGGGRLYWRSDNTLVSTMRPDNIVSWNITTGEPSFEWKYEWDKLEQLTFTKDLSRYIMVSDTCNLVSLHDGQTGEVVSSLSINPVGCRDRVISADGMRVVLIGNEQATVVDLAASRSWSISGIPGQTEYGYYDEIVLSPDGNVLAFGLYDRTISVWDTAAGQFRHTLAGEDEILGLYFNKAGTTLAALTQQSSRSIPTIQLWDIQTGQNIQTLKGPEYTGVEAIAFDPNDTRIAGVGYDRVLLWDLKGGKLIQTLWAEDDNSLLYTLSWSPDGTMIATSSEHEGILIWKTEP